MNNLDILFKIIIGSVLLVIAFLILMCPLYFMFTESWIAIFAFFVSWIPAKIVASLGAIIYEN